MTGRQRPVRDLIAGVLLTLVSISAIIFIGATRRAVIFPAAAAIIGAFWIRQAWVEMRSWRGRTRGRRP